MRMPLFALWPAFLGALIRKDCDVFGIAQDSSTPSRRADAIGTPLGMTGLVLSSRAKSRDLHPGGIRHSMCDTVYLEAEVGETLAAWARSPARNQLA